MYETAIITTKKNIKQLAYTLDAINLECGNHVNYLNSLCYIRHGDTINDDNQYYEKALSIQNELCKYKDAIIDSNNIANCENSWETTGSIDNITVRNTNWDLLDSFYVYYTN